MQEARLGTKTFLTLTGISAPTMRVLEARGVIKPAKSDSGWRVFSMRDVAAARAWRKSRPPRRHREAATAG